MNILIIGSGGREHVFTWKIAQSPLADKLFVAPGNAGTAKIAQNIELNPSHHEAVKRFCLEEKIGMVVVGPEAPLVEGLGDYFMQDEALQSIAFIGPGKIGAELEGSKDFAKAFMQRHQIPTARYETFTAENLEKGYQFLESLKPPYVLKADGLAAGKGVLITKDISEAKAILKEMLVDQKFGNASSKVVIEEFLDGIELSVFVLTDGKEYVTLPAAKDYKRIGEGDTGLNTGGMGAVSPVPFADEAYLQKVEERIIAPTLSGLQADKIPYKGFIFLGLMNVGGDPYVIEYNVRMGDPETQVVIPRIENDLVALFQATHEGSLGTQKLKISEETATTVVMVSGGYPESYAKGKTISGTDEVAEAIVFHAGTKENNGQIQTSGGRVLALTGKGKSLEEALANSYAGVRKISWDGVYYRKDIGQDLLALLKND